MDERDEEFEAWLDQLEQDERRAIQESFDGSAEG